MNDKMIYILSVGIAFYAGMKLTQKQVVVKEVIKEVRVENGASKTIISLRGNLEQCVKEYNELVEVANKDIQDLKSEVDSCEDKYYSPKPNEIEENLYPEEVTDKEPKR